MSDEYDDVREVDPAFDHMAMMLTPDELAEYAAEVRGSTGYAVHQAGKAIQDFMVTFSRVFTDAADRAIDRMRGR